jgi:hypothetical protein
MAGKQEINPKQGTLLTINGRLKAEGLKKDDSSLHIYINEEQWKTDNNAKVNHHNYRRERFAISTT